MGPSPRCLSAGWGQPAAQPCRPTATCPSNITSDMRPHHFNRALVAALACLLVIQALAQVFLPARRITPALPSGVVWTNAQRAWFVQYQATDDQFTLTLSSNGTDVVVTGPGGGAGVVSNTWYFIYAHYDFTNSKAVISLNNSTHTTNSYGSGLYQSVADIVAGALFADRVAYRLLDGDMDETGLWSRPLTTAERTALYNAGSGLTYPFTGTSSLTNGLISYWRMDEVSGNRSDVLGVNTLTGENNPLNTTGVITNAARMRVFSQQYMHVPYSTGGEAFGTNSFATAFWVRFITVPTYFAGLLGHYDIGSGGSGSSLTNSLVAYWRLDEESGTRDDVIGGSDASPVNTPGFTPIAKVGFASSHVRASSQYLSVADSSTISVGGDIDFSMAGWLQNTSVANDQFVIGQYDTGAGQRAWGLQYNTAGVEYRVNMSGNGTVVTTLNTGLGGLSTAWNYVAIVHDAAANLIKFSLNGGAFVTTAFSGGVLDSTAALTIGCVLNSGAPLQPSDVNVDELGLWKRTLSLAEVQTLYSAGFGLGYPFGGQ